MSLQAFRLDEKLAERRLQQRLRQSKTHDSAQGVWLVRDGRRFRNFSSNDYLGLAAHPQVQAALVDAAGRYGVGSGAAHLVCGHTREHQALEEELAAFTGREAALLFSTGYMANLGLIQALAGRGDAVFEDRLNHASLLDGGLTSAARFQRYRHNDLAHLRTLLETTDANARLLVTDAVFSMDGDQAPLPGLAALAREHQAALMVDDAHGFGVLGPQGQGAPAASGCSADDIPVYMATLGKALGTFGAFVAGSRTLIDYLTNFARPFIYTTAMPPALAAATRQSLRLVQAETWRREHLQQLIRRFRREALAQGWPLMPSETAIQPLLLGEESRALALSAALEKRGFWVTAIRPPTVPVGQSRLRITLTASHNHDDVDALLAALSELRESGL
ncbi:8-amino-7-oxononanoate synthase [Fluviicoccus keumensis]|uniref:8-amino-7-oxononanoate synthase n=1 Tax=Fluviicoccus keumensis TaxID=1435465 RepID=A0A4Q7ZDY7_9GAMM|nr:8-amino-7-oxononanoate synthase [Fluviicoccus keumensis]RZU48275.1 8-amino-7-oxononanoate synthase [Fluviicoccus keumensis]